MFIGSHPAAAHKQEPGDKLYLLPVELTGGAEVILFERRSLPASILSTYYPASENKILCLLKRQPLHHTIRCWRARADQYNINELAWGTSQHDLLTITTASTRTKQLQVQVQQDKESTRN